MKVLIIGSGGREHALAWKLSQSPRLEKLWIAPGNPGTAEFGTNVPISVENASAIVTFCLQEHIDLVVVGPEAALMAGVTDLLTSHAIPVFGPSLAAAQIETSKSFSKQFMLRHGIPTPHFASFRDIREALAYLDQVETPIVIKASGLAAGKGVILPESKDQAQQCLHDMLVKGTFGPAGNEVLIEERVSGEEITLMAFCDGVDFQVMPPAQDHKRLLDGDLGPNTGGMGAYAPAPVCTPEMTRMIGKTVLQPALDGLRSEGIPFIGVLYAGLILTNRGIQVLEFNARFGDPEAQVVLPLLQTDLMDIMLACTTQTLSQLNMKWKPCFTTCVVLASPGYPAGTSPAIPITLPENEPDETIIFQAGTQRQNGGLVAYGGRVLGITGIGPDLSTASARSYQFIDQIHFPGAQFRRDIASRAMKSQSAYARAGVNIDTGTKAVEMIRAAVQSTYTARVLSDVGSFGGLFSAIDIQSMQDPVLVASTDGVGTKVKLASRLGCYRGIGVDIVNHCINDILVQGARPLFFLDYFATANLQPEILSEIVEGMSAACREAGCSLIGGETAEMPGVYLQGEFDVAGTIVGCVERNQILPRSGIFAGDCLVGLRSNGAHTNGYSLLRQLFADVNLDECLPGEDRSLAEMLLAPHRSYFPSLWPLLHNHPGLIKGLVHITGGGFFENIPRILPAGLGAIIQSQSWPVAPLFAFAQEIGSISSEEMYRVFNMGIGMVIVVAPEKVSLLKSLIAEETWLIGEIVSDDRRKVTLIPC